jgi:ribulose-phosphate 3-epimerase
MSQIVSPSLLSANFGNLQEDLKMINSSNADWLHIDIMAIPMLQQEQQ